MKTEKDSKTVKFNEIEKNDEFENSSDQSVSHLQNKIEFEVENSDTHVRAETWNTSHGFNMCTNLKFDYNLLKWTDNEFTENENSVLKWIYYLLII